MQLERDRVTSFKAPFNEQRACAIKTILRVCLSPDRLAVVTATRMERQQLVPATMPGGMISVFPDDADFTFSKRCRIYNVHTREKEHDFVVEG